MSLYIQAGFWLFAVLSVYSYVVYPLILRLLPDRPAPGKQSANYRPPVTIVVAAHNEEMRIRAKLDALLALPPYAGQLEILVASDASDDATDEIVHEYGGEGVHLVRNDARDGKEAAQWLAILAATGDVVVFTDVSTSMRGDVLTRIAEHFSVPEIGAISSTDRFIDKNGQPSGEGAYVRYEMWLRRQEMRVSSLIGLSGSFFAVRRNICRENWDTTIPSDFMSAINCVRQGYLAIQADDVLGYYPDLADSDKEFGRKVRTVLRGMRALVSERAILNPFRHGLFAFQLWSHKVFRWLTPWFLLLLALFTVCAASLGIVYQGVLAAQALFYGLALLGTMSMRARSNPAIRLAYYFCLSNLAVAKAGVQLLQGKSALTWTPSAR